MRITCCRARCRGRNWPQGVQAFLVTRQIFAGAGKFAIEEEDRFVSPGFQISQRSDFFSELQSVDTMQRRPIVNTRDEPHANPRLYRRFHVIIGDANMSPFATRLKIGTTALVLEALARDPRRVWPELADPLEALPAISRDPQFRWEVELAGHQTSTALAIAAGIPGGGEGGVRFVTAGQGRDGGGLGDGAGRFGDGRDALPQPAGLGGEAGVGPGISGGAKTGAGRSVAAKPGFGISPAGSGGRVILRIGAGRRHLGVPDEKAVRRAVGEPPHTTRAYVRGKCVQKFPAAVESAQWDHITLQAGEELIKISLMDLFAPEEILRQGRAIERAQSPEDLRILKSVS